MDWKGIPVMAVGKVDRLRQSRVDDGIYSWETKTTSGSVRNYSEQTRPNHQITMYKWAVQELLGISVTGGILDVIHVPDRKVNGKFPDGIDDDKDFGRFETRRSPTDVDEFLFDLRLATERYLSLRDSGLRRWHRNAPTACFMFGGCHYRPICSTNLLESVIKTKFKVERWEPWRGIVGDHSKSE